MMEVLRTPRMSFRRFTSGDARLFHALDSDPEVMRFISKGAPTPLAEIEQVILPRVLASYGDGHPQGCWAAHSLETGDFLGWFHLRPDRIEPADMELGYRLHRRFWGQGLATEGAKALIKSAFGDWGYSKVSARTLLTNLVSQKVMRKAGLEFEKEFVYSEAMIPGWTEEERRAVKYSGCRPQLHQPA